MKEGPAASGPDFSRSKQLWERACRLIPGGTNTHSKRVTTFLDPDHFPSYATRGEGPYLFDSDGRRYIDYIASLGPVILGYGDPRLRARIKAQVDLGWLFSLPDPAEVALSELLTEIIPCCERVRLFKTGAEATSAAVRCARLVTGKELILQCGYHGWHDWWAVTNYPKGIPGATASLTASFRYNDFDSFSEALNRDGPRAAAIVISPAGYGQNPAPGFLELIRGQAAERGIVLVFDEIITGFRWALGGAQEKYGVIPDLACIGKSMANGMPLSALVGKARYLDALGSTWMSSTYASESLSIAAALETIAILREGWVYPHLYGLAQTLNRGLADRASAAGVSIRLGAELPALRFEFECPAEQTAPRCATFVRECAARGVLVRRDEGGISLCLMAALAEAEVRTTLDVASRAFRMVAEIK